MTSLRAALVLAAAIIVLFGHRLFVSDVPVYRDLLVLFVPLRSWAQLAIVRGENLLWCPDLFFGAPFLANYQSAILYPPSLLTHLLPLTPGVGLYLGFHLVLAGVGAHRLLVGRHGLSEAAAVFGAVTFALGGYVVSLLSLTNQLAAAAWLPWTVDAAQGLARRPSRAAFARCSLLIALPSLVGAPETVVIIVLLATVVAAADAERRAPWATVVVLMGCAAAFASALSAAQLLPTLEYYRETDRAAGLALAEVVRESLTLQAFQQFLLPPAFSDGGPPLYPEGGVPLVFSLYVGATALVLAVAGATARPLRIWVWVAIASALLASEAVTPLLAAVHDVSPRLAGAFRYPVKLFLPAHLAIAVLAAVGLDRVLDRSHRLRAASITTAALLAAGIVVATIGIVAPGKLLTALGYELRAGLSQGVLELVAAPLAGQGARLSAFLAVTIAVIVATRQARLRPALGSLALVGIAVADLLPVHGGPLVGLPWRELRGSVDPASIGMRAGDRIFHYCTGGFGCIAPRDPGLGAWVGSVRALEPVAPRARELWSALVPGVPLVYGLGAVAGHDGFATHARRDLLEVLAKLPRDRAVHLLRSLGVRWLIGLQPLDGDGVELEAAAPRSSAFVYEIRGTAPRSYLATELVEATDRAEALVRAAAPSFAAGKTAVVERPPGEAAPGMGTIESVSFEDSVIRATIVGDEQSLWVVNDTHFPGWVASIDERPTPIERVNGVVRGVRVPPGRHEVEMRYRPSSVRAGAAISGFALAVLALMMIPHERFRSDGRH